MTTFNSETVVRTKRRWLRLACFGPSLAGVVVLFAFIATGRGISGVFFALSQLAQAGGILLFAYCWKRSWRAERGEVHADETGLWLDARCVATRTSLRHGYVLRRGDQTVVLLGRSQFDPIEVDVTDSTQADALLNAMRLDAKSSLAEYRMVSGTWSGSCIRGYVSFAIFVATTTAACALESFTLVVGSMLLVGCGLCLYSLNQFLRVAVGTDGMNVRTWLGSTRFVPFSQIESAETDGRDIRIRLAHEAVVLIHHPVGRGWKPPMAEHRVLEGRKLVERINEQLVLHRSHATVDAAAFARSGRSVEAWIASARAAAEQRASFRTAATPRDALWRIVEDATAVPSARAGAAVALRDELDDEGRVRLRGVSEACALPRLRGALESVATGDDEHVRRALAALTE